LGEDGGRCEDGGCELREWCISLHLGASPQNGWWAEPTLRDIQLRKSTSLPIGAVVRAGDENSGGIAAGDAGRRVFWWPRGLRFARRGRAPEWGGASAGPGVRAETVRTCSVPHDVAHRACPPPPSRTHGMRCTWRRPRAWHPEKGRGLTSGLPMPVKLSPDRRQAPVLRNRPSEAIRRCDLLELAPKS
jgi:hypothetical protein